MRMAAYTWILSLCLIFGKSILCDREIVEQLFSTIPSRSDKFCPALNYFKCKSGKCIDASLRCDGIRHCEDGSDEDACSITTLVTTNNKALRTVIKRAIRKKCVIPSISGSLYSNDSNPNIILLHGTEVDDSTIVTVNCEKGYYKSSPHDVIMSCQSGKWRPMNLKLCLKMCPPVKSDSLDITCTFGGNYADCTKQASIPGTKLTPKCKSTHHLENGKLETPIVLQCNDMGMWIGGELYSCQPICGQENIQNKVLIVNGTKAKYGTAPWNVGIYYRKDDTKEFVIICGGSLISLNLVVSAAHCFSDGEVREIPITILYHQYKIATGKYKRDFNVIDNEFTQFFDVLEVFLKHAYTGFSRSYADDIAVIALKSKVTVSVVVSPVCMNWKSRFNIPNGSFGKVVGWGITEKDVPSPILLEKELQFFEIKNCLNKFSPNFYKYLTNDKFCVDDPSGFGGVNSGDSGAGLTYKYDNSYYLTGVVSSKDRENKYTGAIFTDIHYHIDWITKIYNDFKINPFNLTKIICSQSGDWSIIYRNLCSTKVKPQLPTIRKGTCVIPSINGHLYYLRSKPYNYLPHGYEIQELTTVDVKCNSDYWSEYISLRLTMVCKSNGQWSKTYPDLCSEKCPPQLSDSLELTCSYDGKLTDCSKPSIQGTKLIPKCKSTHNLPYGMTETPIELYCSNNGTWIGGELYTCQPICGKLFVETKNINGVETKFSFEPWNVMIYNRKNKTEKYEKYFGGSLISSNLVISNAHHFWDFKIRETTITNLHGLYRATIGKFTKYAKTRDTDFFNLLIVYIPETYIGKDSQYLEDIAIIVLDTKVTFSNVVAPVCIDWDNRYEYDVSNGSIGKIFDWFSKDGNKSIDTIIEKQIPFIDQKNCRGLIPNIEDRTYLTKDKFCSRTDEKNNIDDGIGRGLTFEHKHFHYLTGILSIKGTNRLQSMYFFTDVRYHIDWISQIYKDVSSNSNNVRMIICSGSRNWSSSYRKLCSKVCPSKKSDSLDINCTYNGYNVDCANELSIAGTVLTSKCKSSHHLKNGKLETPIQLQCHENGTWIGRELYTCQPICGRVVHDTKLLTHNGTEEKYVLSPWNVGIYDFDNDTNAFDLMCGGTLISSNLVLSTAYCFWDDELPETVIKNFLSRYKVSVGKYFKDYNHSDSNIFDLLIIYMPENYIGKYNYNSDDIAVVVLKSKVTFSRMIAPICIDWNKQYTFQNGSIGKVVIWNYQEANATLLEKELPFIYRKNCVKIIGSGFYGYMTADKFCSITNSDLITTNMYVGGGFTSEQNNSQFLTGIYNGHTTGFPVILFTDVRHHIEWIKQLYLNYTTSSIEF